MGIGTSLGAFYEDEHHYNSVLWDPERFQGDELMVKTPNQTMIDKQLDDAELDPTTGLGIEVSMKDFRPADDSIIDRQKDGGFKYDIRDSDNIPLASRMQNFFGLDFLTPQPPPHTSNPLAKDLGYNDIKKPSKEEVNKFKQDVENMNTVADPFTEAQPEDLIGQLIDRLEKK